ncbi:MAG: hypothetical protein AB7K73_15145 [Gammaproteobacteria bacterium]
MSVGMETMEDVLVAQIVQPEWRELCAGSVCRLLCRARPPVLLSVFAMENAERVGARAAHDAHTQRTRSGTNPGTGAAP